MSSEKGPAPAEVVLGFLEEAKQWRLLPLQFPSKVGGRPAWLAHGHLPSPAELQCEQCRLPMVFLLQVGGLESHSRLKFELPLNAHARRVVGSVVPTDTGGLIDRE